MSNVKLFGKNRKKTIAIDRLILHAATFSFHYQTKYIEKYEENRKQIEKIE